MSPAPLSDPGAVPGPASPPGFVNFARSNASWLGAGALLTLASSLGQTFLIALFAEPIRAEFNLSHAAWGGIYTAGTFASAALMLWAGGLADRFRARSLATALLLGAAAACFFASQVWGTISLTLAIFALRFCGQGMLYNTAMVCMGRWFSAQRGRAVAIADLGISLGEATAPALFVALIAAFGWREAWMAAALIALALAPFPALLLKRERTPRSMAETHSFPGLGGLHWTRRMALSHPLYWIALPGFLAQPVFTTAFFFQQAHLAQIKSWTLAEFTALFPLYVLVGTPVGFLTGWATDRVGAQRLMPLWPFFLGLSLLCAALGDGVWAAAGSMSLLGVAMGLGSTLTGAWLPEVFGTRHLGAIRAVSVSAMVFATALGPGLTGWLIDAGVHFETQLSAMALYSFLMVGVFLWAQWRARRDFPNPEGAG